MLEALARPGILTVRAVVPTLVLLRRDRWFRKRVVAAENLCLFLTGGESLDRISRSRSAKVISSMLVYPDRTEFYVVFAIERL